MKKNLQIILKINVILLLLCVIVVQVGGWVEKSETPFTPYNDDENDLYKFELKNDDWKNEWIGEESEGGTNITTSELQDAIYHWLENISVRGHIMSTEDLQEIIAMWLSPTSSPTPTPTPTPEPTIEPITLSGSGQEATSKFQLEKGLSIFKLIHDGNSNFIIWLLDNEGNNIDLLVNEIGEFEGHKAVGIQETGEYLLNINADGNWTVNIEQPRPSYAPPVPMVLEGTGQQASEMFYLDEGLTRFKMTHDGDSNYIIWLLDNEGNKIGLPVNEIGEFDGSKAVGIQEQGIHLLDIDADGNWSINITQPRPSYAPPVPMTLEGTGQQASEMFYLDEGLTRFEMTHDGDHYFGIWLLDNEGNNIDLLVNEIGEFDGSKAVGISIEGIYLLNINADGNWEISIE